MIGNLSYDEILKYAQELKENANVIEHLAKKQDISSLQDFVSNVECYSTFLKSTVELHQDADKVLKQLSTNK